MDNLPKDFKPGFDYSIFITEKESKLIETDKFKVEIIPNTIGSFRNDLNKLRGMRRGKITNNRSNEKTSNEHIITNNEKTTSDNIITSNAFTVTEVKSNYNDDIITNSIDKSFCKPLLLTPSNPLIDQTIKIIKPTEWIDCISRESKRVFVKDNWIVARIRLPSISKDLIGLKRLTLE